MDLVEFNLWARARNVVREHYDIELDSYINFKSSQKLASLLRLTYPYENYWAVLELTEPDKHSLELITGKYGHTIIKMLEARNEWT